MDFDRFLPIIVVFIIWRLSEKMRNRKKRLESLHVDTTNEELNNYEILESDFDTLPSHFEEIIGDPEEVVLESNKKQRAVEKKSKESVNARKKFFLRRAVVWSEILSPPVSMRD